MSAPAMRPLSEVIEDAKPGFACGEQDPDGVFQLRMNNIRRDGTLDLSKQRRVPWDKKAIEGTLLRIGDVLFNATNSPDLVGKSALIDTLQEPMVYSNHFIRLRTRPEVLIPPYLARWLSWQFQHGTFKGICRQWVNQATVGKDSLLNLPIPLPSTEEQWRVTEILNQADMLRAKRRQTLVLLDELACSIFLDMFGAGIQFGMPCRLGEVAEVVSGITKGRKPLNAATLKTVPYLAVVNVQDKRLDLSSVKTIEASAEEIERYRLRKNDLLLTEGGDPDKLGRGTLWNGELPVAIHQNHIFRVRLKASADISPTYLNWYVASEYGRRYFLRSAKQTTGIASINATQLKDFPVQVPSRQRQELFERRVAYVHDVRSLHLAHLAELDDLYGSLQQRAFRGEL